MKEALSLSLSLYVLQYLPCSVVRNAVCIVDPLFLVHSKAGHITPIYIYIYIYIYIFPYAIRSFYFYNTFVRQFGVTQGSGRLLLRHSDVTYRRAASLTEL